MKAIWNGTTIAESNDTLVIEGNHYFPLESVNQELLLPSDTHTSCAWKGVASYYTLKVGDQQNKDAVWYYPEPSELASGIKGKVAFWKGVQVVK
jgi:uncharacterized protein (DUF427 family)